MADTKISALGAVAAIADADELVLASAGLSKKITGANFKLSTGGWTTIVKPADESVTNSTVLQKDDHLLFPCVASQLYDIDMTIVYAASPNSSVPDIVIKLQDDAGGAGAFHLLGFTTGDTVQSVGYNSDGGLATATFGTPNNRTRAIRVIGWHVPASGAGNFFALWWAQATVSATNATVVKAGSTLRYRRVF